MSGLAELLVGGDGVIFVVHFMLEDIEPLPDFAECVGDPMILRKVIRRVAGPNSSSTPGVFWPLALAACHASGSGT